MLTRWDCPKPLLTHLDLLLVPSRWQKSPCCHCTINCEPTDNTSPRRCTTTANAVGTQPGRMVQRDWPVSTACDSLCDEGQFILSSAFCWKSWLVKIPLRDAWKLWGFLVFCFVLFWRYNEDFALEACSNPVMLWLMSLYNSDKLKPSQGAHSSWISL